MNNDGSKFEMILQRFIPKIDTQPVPCKYIFSLMMYTVNNLDNFQTNSVVHRMNTRTKNQFHRPTVYLSCIQKGVFYSSIKVLNLYSISEIKTGENKI